jgi:hypothetical protein
LNTFLSPGIATTIDMNYFLFIVTDYDVRLLFLLLLLLLHRSRHRRNLLVRMDVIILLSRVWNSTLDMSDLLFTVSCSVVWCSETSHNSLCTAHRISRSVIVFNSSAVIWQIHQACCFCVLPCNDIYHCFLLWTTSFFATPSVMEDAYHLRISVFLYVIP